MVKSALPVVFVVSQRPDHAASLQQVLSQAEVHHVPDADTLLREAHLRLPHAVLLYPRASATESGAPLSQVLGILRQRAELAGTQWAAVGSQGLGELLSAGADVLISDSTPPEGLAVQVGNMLARAQQHLELQERLGRLQHRIEELEHDERVRDQLVHMLVHDLKNPISAVMGLLEVVEDDGRVPADSRELLRIARDEAQHLLHLTVNMLDVRKIQAGKMNLRRELLFSPMLSEVIEQARGDVGGGLRERQVTVQVAQNLSPVDADPELLRRVLANLISNALKHTTAGGTIAIAAQQDGPDNLRISVRDNGEGIPADDLPNLFAAFEQSRLTLHGRFDTGMGLAFCKMAIEEHGGHIWVESERGQGSLFSFTIPFAQDSEDDEDFAELLS